MNDENTPKTEASDEEFYNPDFNENKEKPNSASELQETEDPAAIETDEADDTINEELQTIKSNDGFEDEDNMEEPQGNDRPFSFDNVNPLRDAYFINNMHQKDHNDQKNKTMSFDPTISFNFSDDLTEYDIEEGFSTVTKKFWKEPFVLIACDDPPIGMSALKQLYRTYDHKEKGSVREFSTLGIKENEKLAHSFRMDESGDYFSLFFLHENLGDIPKNTTIVIDLTSERNIDARSFLTQLLDSNAGEGYFERLKKHLTEHSLRIICLAPQKMVGAELPQYRFHIWQINPIRVLIYHYYPAEAKKLFEMLQRQIKLNDWGIDPLGDVRNAINQNTLIHSIEKYEGRSAEPEEKDDLQYYLSLLKHNTPYAALNEAVLFTSLYFPKLSEPLFEEVLSILLGGVLVSEFAVKKMNSAGTQRNEKPNDVDSQQAQKQINVTVKIDDTDINVNTLDNNQQESTQNKSYIENHDEGNEPDDVSLRSKLDHFKLETDATLMDLWVKGGRKEISNSTKITLINIPNGRSYIWFKEPHLSKSASEALRISDPFYFSKYFNRVLESGLVFHDSKFIADSALELIRQRMLLNPDLYDYRWLSSWVGKALIMIQIARDIQPENVEELGGQLQILGSEPLLMDRWTKLLRMMLGDDKLAKVTNEFLSNLFIIRQYERILQFAIRLKNAPGFDVLYWLKRLIAESNEEVREQSFFYLLGFYRKNILQKPELLEELLAWLPSSDTNKNFPPLQQVALFLPLFLIVGAINEFDTKSKSPLKTLFPIISGRTPEEVDLSVAFEGLITVLLHARQGFDQLVTKDLLHQVVRKLLSNIQITGQKYKKGAKSITGMRPLSDLILQQPAACLNFYDTLLAFILVAWAWQLLAGSKQDASYQNGEEVLNKITGTFVNRLQTKRLNNIRNFLRESRQLVSDSKSKAKHKEDHLTMSRYIRVSRIVANSIYKNKKSK